MRGIAKKINPIIKELIIINIWWIYNLANILANFLLHFDDLPPENLNRS